MSDNTQMSWKYEVGDLLCAPRQTADSVWGTLIVMERISNAVLHYECWSQNANRMISMPKRVLEEGWYVPKEKHKATTNTELPS